MRQKASETAKSSKAADRASKLVTIKITYDNSAVCYSDWKKAQKTRFRKGMRVVEAGLPTTGLCNRSSVDFI
jgi:hypothetical protein